MRNLAIKPKFLSIYQQYGVVTQTGATLWVQTDAALYKARKAPSCLLEPMLGDKVLVVTDLEGGDYVLAVLERTENSLSSVIFSGAAEIRTADGTLNLSGRDGVAIASPSLVSLHAARVDVTALQGDVTIENLSLAGHAWRSCIDQVKTVGRTLDVLLERCHLRAARSYRVVEELDQVKAGQIDYQADTSLQLHAKYALVTADQLVKMDAEQIHLG